MKLEDLKKAIELIKELDNSTNETNHNSVGNKYFKIGEKYFIRTVLYFYIGIVVEENDKFIVLDNVSWIGDQGRVHEAMEKGIPEASSSEIELYPKNQKTHLQIDSIVEYFEYKFDLPKKNK